MIIDKIAEEPMAWAVEKIDLDSPIFLRGCVSHFYSIVKGGSYAIVKGHGNVIETPDCFEVHGLLWPENEEL